MRILPTSIWGACSSTIARNRTVSTLAGTFWTYAGICVAGLILVALRLPETKSRSLEEIERELVG